MDNNSVSLTTVANSPWRLFGEVKRHRTLRQSAESIYIAVDRTLELVKETGDKVREGRTEDLGLLADEYQNVFSMPPAVKQDPEKLKLWLGRVVDSFETYEQLRKSGVLESDAIHVIPRGIKIGIEKRFDLYNMTLGYLSLRLCNTCEPEMRRTSEQERDLMLQSNLSDGVKNLLTPKCSYVGFCPEGSYDKRCCKKVHTFVPGYNGELHAQIQKGRKGEILAEINKGKGKVK